MRVITLYLKKTRLHQFLQNTILKCEQIALGNDGTIDDIEINEEKFKISKETKIKKTNTLKLFKRIFNYKLQLLLD